MIMQIHGKNKETQCDWSVSSSHKVSHKWLATPGGVPRDPSDGDVRRIFLGSKFSISGFFGVREFGRYFFG